MPSLIAGRTISAWRRRLAYWCRLWGVPKLKTGLRIAVSSRLRISLGSFNARQGQIRISSLLVDAPTPLLDEVLCHEAAHAAVAQLHKGRARPHGPEWRALIRVAGFEPHCRIREDAVGRGVSQTRRSRAHWEHRCPVCQACRIAGRPIYRWRCAACRDAGLDGGLIIIRAAGATGRST